MLSSCIRHGQTIGNACSFRVDTKSSRKYCHVGGHVFIRWTELYWPKVFCVQRKIKPNPNRISKRITLSLLRAHSIQGRPCTVRPAERTARMIEVRAVLHHCVPYKGLHPLRSFGSYPSALCSGSNLLSADSPRRKV